MTTWEVRVKRKDGKEGFHVTVAETAEEAMKIVKESETVEKVISADPYGTYTKRLQTMWNNFFDKLDKVEEDGKEV